MRTPDISSSMSSDVDEILETLCHHCRREIIDYFEQRPETSEATVSDLVDHIGGRGSESERRQLEMYLFHTHLPKLAATDWLDFDREERRVRFHGHDGAEPALNELDELLR